MSPNNLHTPPLDAHQHGISQTRSFTNCRSVLYHRFTLPRRHRACSLCFLASLFRFLASSSLILLFSSSSSASQKGSQRLRISRGGVKEQRPGPRYQKAKLNEKNRRESQPMRGSQRAMCGAFSPPEFQEGCNVLNRVTDPIRNTCNQHSETDRQQSSHMARGGGVFSSRHSVVKLHLNVPKVGSKDMVTDCLTVATSTNMYICGRLIRTRDVTESSHFHPPLLLDLVTLFVVFVNGANDLWSLYRNDEHLGRSESII